MPKITTWVRAEPNESTFPLVTLRAEVRDPLWMLGRQWQLGEFHGEDSGSPAHMEMRYHETWFYSGRPLEHQLNIQRRRQTSPDIGASQVGQYVPAITCAQIICEAISPPHRDTLRRLLLARLPLVQPGASDRQALRLYRSAASTWFDGQGILAIRSLVSADTLFPLDSTTVDEFRKGCGDAETWLRDTGQLGGGADPVRWNHSRLCYTVGASSYELPKDFTKAAFNLNVTPGPENEIDWYCCNTQRNAGTNNEPTTQRMLPAFVTFAGAPNHRFWDFEDGNVNFDRVITGDQELPKKEVLDFMAIHGNDWFIIPLEQKVGTLVEVVQVDVHDVFGDMTPVRPAMSVDPSWKMFTNPLPLLPAIGHHAIRGPVIEETTFRRDEVANLVWAIESQVHSGAGGSYLCAKDSTTTPEPESEGWRYTLFTTVPRHWHPFAPVPKAKSPMLRREVVRVDGDLAYPQGLVLQYEPEDIHDEEITRLGLRIRMHHYMGRWLDGSTWSWTAYDRDLSTGEIESGLAFDNLRNVRAPGPR